MKTIVVMGDTHCGSRVGLTPPKWQYNADTAHGKLQRLCWDFYADNVPRGADALIYMGDAIDGKGERSGGTEQNRADRHEQCLMACECVRAAAPKRVLMCYGTGYHVGTDEDWEDVVKDMLCAEGIPAELGPHEAVEVDGLVFDIKHKVGSSAIPHGRHTAIARERLWNLEWCQRGQRAKADIILRAHVHYFNYAGGAEWFGATLPGLQGLGGKYGSRECAGTVDFGFLVFRVDLGRAGQGKSGRGVDRRGKGFFGRVQFEPVLMPLSQMPTKAISV